MKKGIAITFVFAVITATPLLWQSILTVRGTGGWSKSGLEVVFPILLGFAIWLLRSIITFSRSPECREQTEEDLSSQITVGIVIGFALGIWLSGDLRMYGFELAVERAEPLINAIEQYTQDNGAPPDSIAALVPTYIPEMPAKLPPVEMVTDPKKLPEYGDNPWALTALVSKNLMNWDRFVYFPDQEYPERGFGGGLERVGDWAYVHE